MILQGLVSSLSQLTSFKLVVADNENNVLLMCVKFEIDSVGFSRGNTLIYCLSQEYIEHSSTDCKHFTKKTQGEMFEGKTVQIGNH